MVKAIYPGSFDPVTFGHLDLVKRAVQVFGSLTVAVARNSAKPGVFTIEERVDILREETAGIKGVKVGSFDGLVVDFCREKGFTVILRGVRTVSDFEYEYQMALTNRHLADAVETVFMMPNERFGFVSSTLIKDVLSYGGDVSEWLSPSVCKDLKRKLENRK